MSHIKNDVLSTTVNKPALYAQFIDDIIIVVNDGKHLTDLKKNGKKVCFKIHVYRI